ncbi:MAG: glutamine amidotransferase-related protein, partial [Alphaproteobacteria bacterium]
KKLPEIIELTDHPFFIAVQFHPELKSKPFKAHPLFVEFVKNALIFKKSNLKKSK